MGGNFAGLGAMTERKRAWMSASIVIFLTAAGSISAEAGAACFTAGRIYQVHPLRGGADAKDSWSVRGEAFNQCVRQAEAADRTLRARYPETLYALSMTSTIGCHEGC